MSLRSEDNGEADSGYEGLTPSDGFDAMTPIEQTLHQVTPGSKG